MQQTHALANTVSKILQHRRKVSPHSFSIVRETDSSAEAVGSVCKRDRTRVLISPSSLRRLENNHSLPSNILSIRQSSSSHPYTGARRSHCRERWGVNRMSSLPPPPHLYPQFSPIYSSRQVQFYMLYEARAVRMYVPEVETTCSHQMHLHSICGNTLKASVPYIFLDFHFHPWLEWGVSY